ALEIDVLSLKQARLGNPEAVEVDGQEERLVPGTRDCREKYSDLILAEVAREGPLDDHELPPFEGRRRSRTTESRGARPSFIGSAIAGSRSGAPTRSTTSAAASIGSIRGPAMAYRGGSG